MEGGVAHTPWLPLPPAVGARRDLELQLQTEQVHVTPVSAALASHRTAAGYANFGERLYVEGRLEALRKQKLVRRT